MGFSNDQIGFYLAMEDTTAPVQKKALRNYGRFVDAMEGLNKRAYKSASGATDQLSGMLKGFAELPKTAAKSYQQATRALQGKVKPIRIPVMFDMQGGPGGKARGAGMTRTNDKMGEMIGKAVVKALSKSPIRLTAAVPTKRSKFFDSTLSLRQLYKKIPQPPDFVGSVLPKYAKGRAGGGKKVTRGAGPKIDDQVAILAREEMVLPGDMSDMLMRIAGQARDISGSFTPLPKDFAENMARVENLMKAMPMNRAMAEAGADKEGMKKFEASAREADMLIKKLMTDTGNMDKVWRARVLPTFVNFHKELTGIKKEAEEAGSLLHRLFGKVLGPAGAIAFINGVKGMGGALKSMALEVDSHTGILNAAQQLDHHWKSLQQTWHDSPAEMRVLKDDLAKLANALPAGATNMEAMAESMLEMQRLGTEKGFAVKAAASVSMFSRATGVASVEVATLASSFNNAGISAGKVEDTLARIQRGSKGSSVALGDVTASLDAFVKANQLDLQAMGEGKAQTMIESVSRLTTAGEATQKGAGVGLAHLITSAMSDATQMASLSAMSGMPPVAIKEALATGNIDGLASALSTKFAGLSQQQLTSVAQSIGVEPSLLMGLAQPNGKLMAMLKKTGAAPVAPGGGKTVLAESVKEQQTLMAGAEKGIEAVKTTGLSSVDANTAMSMTPLASSATAVLGSAADVGKYALETAIGARAIGSTGWGAKLAGQLSKVPGLGRIIPALFGTGVSAAAATTGSAAMPALPALAGQGATAATGMTGSALMRGALGVAGKAAIPLSMAQMSIGTMGDAEPPEIAMARKAEMDERRRAEVGDAEFNRQTRRANFEDYYQKKHPFASWMRGWVPGMSPAPFGDTEAESEFDKSRGTSNRPPSAMAPPPPYTPPLAVTAADRDSDLEELVKQQAAALEVMNKTLGMLLGVQTEALRRQKIPNSSVMDRVSGSR